MVEDEWWLHGVGIFEPGEHLSGLNTLRTLLALLWFRHYFARFQRSVNEVFVG
jgi:hypothetical protein